MPNATQWFEGFREASMSVSVSSTIMTTIRLSVDKRIKHNPLHGVDKCFHIFLKTFGNSVRNIKNNQQANVLFVKISCLVSRFS